MKQVEFTNFIGFGNRISIDIRCSYFDVAAWNNVLKQRGHVAWSDGVVKQIHLSTEMQSTGDGDGMAIEFNEAASRLLVDLAVQLHNAGLSALHVELAKRLSYAQGEREGTAEDVYSTFAHLITLITELNSEKFRVEE
jgi:hypothetical protein